MAFLPHVGRGHLRCLSILATRLAVSQRYVQLSVIFAECSHLNQK